MNDALIGHSGFVGSNLLRQHTFTSLYRSNNIEEIRGRSFDTVVFSAAQAKKWWANLHPEQDWAGIERALLALADVKAREVVLISTIDVLPADVSADERTPLDDEAAHAYGKNRLRLERELSRLFDSLTIVRLPALFGPGLRKNVIFDLLTDNLLAKIQPDSSFQYYDLTRLWSDIQLAKTAGVSLIHLFPEPVSTRSIAERFFPGKQLGAEAGPAQRYDYRTCHAALFGRADGYIFGRDEVLSRLATFIDAWKPEEQR